LQVGCFALHALDGGTLSFAVRGRERRLELAVWPVLVEGPSGSCLYDLGFGDADVERREKFGLRDPEALELQVERILGHAPDVVVLSHLHFDHAGGALRGQGPDERLRFPTSRHVIHPEEWKAGLADGRGSELAARIAAHRVPDFVEDGEALMEGLWVTRHRGHTEGLLVLHGESTRPQGGAPESFMLTADLVPTRHFLRDREDRVADQDPALALEERRALFAELRPKQAWVGLYHDRDHAFVRLCEGAGYALPDGAD
jgi:glyoxylase-like metal-dependent hydrolase (beta-lactamase superfamily II)